MNTENPVALSVVVPVYNGAATVPRLVERLNRLPLREPYEIVLVNDGSADDSARVCRELAQRQPPGVPLVFADLSRNFGEHHAVMAGYRLSRGAYVVNIDDDFQNPPEEIVRVFEYARSQGLDAVYTRCEEKAYAGWRNLGSRLNNRLADWLLDKPRGLYLSSFRCLNRFLVDEILHYEGAFPYIDGLVFQVTQRVGSIQVAQVAREEGRSGYTLRRLVRLALNMMVNFSIMPLRLATLLGLVLGGLGLLGAVYVIVEYFLMKQPPGWTMLMTSMSIFSGAQLVILGIVGEYLGRLYLNVNRRPQFVIREIERGGGNPVTEA